MTGGAHPSRVLPVTALLLCGAHAVSAEQCPEEIYGGWTTSLPIDELLRTEISVSDTGDDVLDTVQPSFRFVGARDDDSEQLAGFVYYSQFAYHTTLPHADDGTWAGAWGPLPVNENELPFDLFFDADGEGGTGAYLFFRDQRLPGLYGLGASCDGNAVEFSEMNLGLSFQGTFNHELTTLTTEASGLGGTVQVTWRRMSEQQQGASEAQPRKAGDAVFIDRAPDVADDGWTTARPSTLGLEVEPLNAMVGDIASGGLPLAHSVV